jgi:uncharacterized protein
MFELSALAIGFLGSFHCVAMCGPIALAMSSSSGSLSKYFLTRAIYNSGRVVTYGILGLAAGMLGHALLLAGIQKSLSIGIGAVMILTVVLMYYVRGGFRSPPILININGFIKRVFSNTLKKKNVTSLFISGLANGILPCGFVYLALAGASATQSPANGALYMILFGLGTIPAMMAVAAFGKLASVKARVFLTKAAPVLMIILGLVLIYRGMTMDPENCPLHNQISFFSF